jgi:hypothetical protein
MGCLRRRGICYTTCKHVRFGADESVIVLTNLHYNNSIYYNIIELYLNVGVCLLILNNQCLVAPPSACYRASARHLLLHWKTGNFSLSYRALKREEFQVKFTSSEPSGLVSPHGSALFGENWGLGVLN